MSNPCESKRFYDTEFEATIAAAKTSALFQAEMMAYECGTHWHIANVEPKMRSKYRPFNKTYCKYCDVYMKRGRYERHQYLAGHLDKVRKMEIEK